jgi:threonine dehydrogenase-like Zn-dependent dehydrogenase
MPAHAATAERSGGLLLVLGLGVIGLCLGVAFR